MIVRGTNQQNNMEQKSLHQQLSEIQQNLKVSKNQFNNFGKYNYRSCEDILEAVKPLLDGKLLTLTDEVVNIGDRNYVKATVKLSCDKTKESISVSAYACEAPQKSGMDAAQITGAASSYARKYALNGLFLIDDTKDADSMDNTQKTAPIVKPESKKEESTAGMVSASVNPNKCNLCGAIDSHKPGCLNI